MIAVKNLQNTSEILNQEKLLQAIAGHYLDMVSDPEASKLLKTIIATSQKNHCEILDYLKHDLGKSPLPKSAGVLNSTPTPKGGKK